MSPIGPMRLMNSGAILSGVQICEEWEVLFFQGVWLKGACLVGGLDERLERVVFGPEGLPGQACEAGRVDGGETFVEMVVLGDDSGRGRGLCEELFEEGRRHAGEVDGEDREVTRACGFEGGGDGSERAAVREEVRDLTGVADGEGFPLTTADEDFGRGQCREGLELVLPEGATLPVEEGLVAPHAGRLAAGDEGGGQVVFHAVTFTVPDVSTRARRPPRPLSAVRAPGAKAVFIHSHGLASLTPWKVTP